VLGWLVFIPTGMFLVRYSGGGTLELMLTLTGYILLLAVTLGLRFASGAWRRISLVEAPLPV